MYWNNSRKGFSPKSKYRLGKKLFTFSFFFLLQTLKVKMKQDSRVYSHGQLCEREVRAI